MTEATTFEGPHQYLSALRQHVLGPLRDAIEIAEQEYREVENEQTAFEEFAARVSAVPTVSAPTQTLPIESTSGESPLQRAAELRAAYRETVMAVPHYTDVYDETIGESLVAEFGPELAELFEPANGISFTAYHKDALVTAAEQSATERGEFHDTLSTERASLGSLCQDLEALLNEFDTNIVPAWYRQRFIERLDDVLQTRQSVLDKRTSVAYLDGHNLCEYLYSEGPWTYPVLTAVARLLDSVVFQERD